MASQISNNRRFRKNFAKIHEVIEISNLIDIQVQSYAKFLQKDTDPDKRENIGLQAVFRSVFPIRDFYETASLECVGYRLGEPKYNVEECLLKGMTYGAPIKVTLRFVVWDVHEETGAKNIKAVKEQEVYFGEIPLMTENGTFIINGTERVIVSQLHRSPGVFFDRDQEKVTGGKAYYYARIIPYRGSWIDFEFDTKDILYVRIDRRRKVPVTILLKALGYTTQELLDYFYDKEEIFIQRGKFFKEVSYDLLLGQKATEDIIDPKTKEVLVRKNRKITKPIVKKLEAAKIRSIPFDSTDLLGRYLANDLVDPETGEVIAECNQPIEEETVEEIKRRKIERFKILFIDHIIVSSSFRDTLVVDKIGMSREEKGKLASTEPGKSPEDRETEKAIIEIYRKLRPGDPPTLDTARNLFYNLFFNPDRYDLSKVGRMKLNLKMGSDVPLEVTVLRREDVLEVVKYLISLKDGRGTVDDIDHLGNRRVRTVGELLENQYHIGLIRIEKAIRERMSLQEVETLMPHDLINS
ncbi:MAG: DNA-directed RNA polymerase subunit beta, partial [Deltaproteobacteria bacterium]|nr:DNA-directed RNA polymerase subunit beta [Deltaproteobacteria bacterium]